MGALLQEVKAFLGIAQSGEAVEYVKWWRQYVDLWVQKLEAIQPRKDGSERVRGDTSSDTR